MALECENYVLERIFEGDNSEKAQNLKKDFNQSLETHLANTKDPFAKRNLNYNFWCVIEYIIKKRVALLEPGQELAFTKFERYAIDYGYISNNIIDPGSGFDENNIDNTLSSTIKITPEFEILTITSWLANELRKFTGVYEYEKMNVEYEKLCAKIEFEKNEKEILLKNKRACLANLGGLLDKQVFIRVATLTHNIEQSNDVYSLIKYKIQSGQVLSKEERLELISLENTMNSTRKERTELLRDQPGINNDLLKCEESLVIKEKTTLELITNKGKAKVDLEKFHEKSMNITNKQKDGFITEKVAHIKLMCELMAKRNKVEPTPCLNSGLPDKLPDSVRLAIASFIEADPLVFKNKQVKLKGHPSLLFVPGCGNGVYSYDENALIFPYYPVKDYQEMVIAGMVLYRWDCDEDRLFRDSYNSLKPYKKFSFVDLQKSLIKDYTIHITRELKGYKIFDKELRDWFKFNVSPKKGEEKKIEIIQGEQEIKVITEAEAVVIQQEESIAEHNYDTAENTEIIGTADNDISEQLHSDDSCTKDSHEGPDASAGTAEKTGIMDSKISDNLDTKPSIIVEKTETVKIEKNDEAAKSVIAEKTANGGSAEKKAQTLNTAGISKTPVSPAANNNIKHNDVKPPQSGIIEKKVNDSDKKPEAVRHSDSQNVLQDKTRNLDHSADNAELLKMKDDIIKSVSAEFSGVFAKKFEELSKIIKSEVTEVLRKEISGISEELKNSRGSVEISEAPKLPPEIIKIEDIKLEDSPKAVNEAEPEVPMSENFKKSRQAIYDKMKSVLKVDDIDSKLKITPSKEGNKIDIKISNLDVFGTELEIILSNFGILSKLHKFTDLFKS